MQPLPRCEKALLRPKESNQDRVGAAAHLTALGSATNQVTKDAGYLFINKSAESESLSNCKAKKTQTKINAHVQRFRLSSRRRKAHSNEDDANRPTSEPRSLYRPFQGRDLEAVAAYAERGNNESGIVGQLRQRTEAFNTRQQVVPLLHSNNFLEGDAFDPFRATAVPVDKATHHVLQYFLHLGWKAHLRNIGRANQSQWSKAFGEVASVVHGCLFNQMHMYAFLACIPMRMEVDGLPSIVPMASPEVRMAKALRAMRAYFDPLSQTAVDHQVILDVFFMSLSKFFRRNFVAMGTHLRMVGHMVNSLGGFGSVSQYIREVCCYTELSFALRTGEAPLFEMTWDPGSMIVNESLGVKSASWPPQIKAFGKGFEDPLQEGFFDGSTRTVIEEQLIDIPALEYVWNNAEAPPVDSQWACVRSQAFLHRLLSLQGIGEQASLQERKGWF